MKTRTSIILLVIITLAVFSSSLNNDFVNWDDKKNLSDNPLVYSLSPRHIKKIFTSTVQDTYIPLTTFTFAIEYSLVRDNPFVYHLDNVLLHILVVCLIFALARQMGLNQTASFFSALLFAVHPLHVESVAWVTERKDVLYALFYVSSMIQYWQYLEKRGLRNYFAALLLGLLSMLAKPMALSLPFILFLLDWLYKKGARPGHWTKNVQCPGLAPFLYNKIPFFLYIIPIASITFQRNADVMSLNLSEGPLIWTWTFAFYLKKFFFPLSLSPYYDLPQPVSLFSLEYLFAACIFILFISAVKKGNAVLRFACLYYLFSIFFLLRFSDVSETSVIVADRFMYLPSLGFCILAGYLIDQAMIKFKTVPMSVFVRVTCTLIFIGLSVKTYQQCNVWDNGYTLWNTVVKQQPRQFYPYKNLANALVEREQYEDALFYYDKAIRLNPNHASTYSNRAAVYTKLGDYQKALRDLNKVIKADPGHVSSLNNRGLIYEKTGRGDLAHVDYSKALNIDPDDPAVLLNRSRLFLSDGLPKKALLDLTRILKINPYQSQAYLNRAVAYTRMNNDPKALEDYEKLIKIDPKNFLAFHNRGNIYGRMNMFDQAIADFTKSIQLNPNYSANYYYRSRCYQSINKLEKALNDALTAKTLGYQISVSYLSELNELTKGK